MIAHIIQLRPTSEQEQYFLRCCGTMRYTYNQLVAKIQNGEKYDRKAFQKFCSGMRQETPWMQEVSSRATYEAADLFHAGMNNWFESCKGNRKGGRVGLPTFKKRGHRDSFRFSHSSQFKVSDRELRLSGSMGSSIRMRERIRFTDDAMNTETLQPGGPRLTRKRVATVY